MWINIMEKIAQENNDKWKLRTAEMNENFPLLYGN